MTVQKIKKDFPRRGFTLTELLTAKQQEMRNKGFTLIELLIVISILGVLAVVVLVAINPVQQLARTRDAGRKSGVSQLGRAAEGYYTAHGGTYLAESATWITDLVDAGEISSEPTEIEGGVAGYTPCLGTGGAVQNGWCYDANTVAGGEPVVVYAKLESDSEIDKCNGDVPFFVWSTEDGRGGLVCETGVAEPGPGAQNWNPVQ